MPPHRGATRCTSTPSWCQSPVKIPIKAPSTCTCAQGASGVADALPVIESVIAPVVVPAVDAIHMPHRDQTRPHTACPRPLCLAAGSLEGACAPAALVPAPHPTRRFCGCHRRFISCWPDLRGCTPPSPCCSAGQPRAASRASSRAALVCNRPLPSNSHPPPHRRHTPAAGRPCREQMSTVQPLGARRGGAAAVRAAACGARGGEAAGEGRAGGRGGGGGGGARHGGVRFRGAAPARSGTGPPPTTGYTLVHPPTHSRGLDSPPAPVSTSAGPPLMSACAHCSAQHGLLVFFPLSYQ